MQDGNKPVRSGDVINIEPIETPQLTKIEPTASFTVDTPADVDPDRKPILETCMVGFYRSMKNADGNKLGTSDDEYTGIFGFDRFNKSTTPNGLIQDKYNYEVLPNIYPENCEIVKDVRKYFCPYLSIWPPIVEINGNNINTNNKHKVTIYAGIEQTKKKIGKKDIKSPDKEGSFLICFEISDSTKVGFEGNADKKTIYKDIKYKKGEKKEKYIPLQLECYKAFSSNIEIVAYNVDPEDRTKKTRVGKLIIVANDKIYRTTLIPVIVNMHDGDSFLTIDETHNANYKKCSDLCNGSALIDFINNHAYNQAYIHFDYDPASLRTIDIYKNLPPGQDKATSGLFYLSDKVKDIVSSTGLTGSDDERLKFTNEIKKIYLQSQGESDEDRRKKKIEQLELDKLLRNYTNRFKKEFKYDPKKLVNEAHKAKIATVAWDHEKTKTEYCKFEDAEDEYDRWFEANNIDATGEGKLNTDKTLYVFFYPDIEKSRGSSDSTSGEVSYVPGFTPTSNIGFKKSEGVCFMFSSCFMLVNGKPQAIEQIVHELGHVLGLDHTFYENGDKKEVIETAEIRQKKRLLEEKIIEIYQVQSEINKLRNAIYVDKTESEILTGLSYGLESLYKQINEEINTDITFEKLWTITLTDGSRTRINRSRYLRLLIYKAIQYECEPIIVEDKIISNTSNAELEKKIEESNRLDSEIKSLGAEIKALSATQNEKIDRYKNKSATQENFTDYGKEGSSFEYKSFYYSQWRTMQEVGVKMKFLEIINVK